LTLIHVIEVPLEAPVDFHQDAVADTVPAYCTIETIVRTGKPYREILQVASDQQSDLIVIGIHGRSAADLLFLGSTAQHMSRQGLCPVLTLRMG
jgi:nucleotide-binding universal stress UspA family protein